MNLLVRLITGDGLRKTRFHDQNGVPVSFSGLRYLPLCVIDCLAYKAFGYKRPVPWLGYKSTEVIAALLSRESHVLEFGMGYSTVWFSHRARHLVSLETEAQWVSKVFAMPSGPASTHTFLTPKIDEDSLSHIPDKSFDFALVDSVQRDLCVKLALKKVKKGGYIYLDNSDVPEYQKAKELLLLAGPSTIFRDFYPGSISVNEGILTCPR